MSSARLKPLRTLLSTVLILTASTAHAAFDARVQWSRLVRAWHMTEVRTCSEGVRSGRARGEWDLKLRANSCAALFLHAGELADFLASAGDFATAADEGVFQGCYRAGWKIGFVSAFQQQWDGCATQLAEGERLSVAARAQTCRAQGIKDRADVETLSAWIIANAAEDSKVEAGQLRGKMLGLVAVGASASAWDELMRQEHGKIQSNLPCQAAYALALEGDLAP